MRFTGQNSCVRRTGKEQVIPREVRLRQTDHEPDAIGTGARPSWPQQLPNFTGFTIDHERLWIWLAAATGTVARRPGRSSYEILSGATIELEHLWIHGRLRPGKTKLPCSMASPARILTAAARMAARRSLWKHKPAKLVAKPGAAPGPAGR